MGDFTGIKIVYSNKKYYLLTLLIAFILYVFNSLINNVQSIKESASFGLQNFFKITLILITGFHKTLDIYSWFTLIIVSILVGILISLVVYKINIKASLKKGNGFFGTLGVILGILAPGCAACGFGIISLLGFGGAIASFFPYHGLELSILAILLLGFSIWKLSKDLLNCEECKNYNYKMKGGIKNE